MRNTQFVIHVEKALVTESIYADFNPWPSKAQRNLNKGFKFALMGLVPTPLPSDCSFIQVSKIKEHKETSQCKCTHLFESPECGGTNEHTELTMVTVFQAS